MKKQKKYIDSFKFTNTKKSISIEIGGISVQISGEEKFVLNFVKDRYSQFLSPQKITDYKIEVHISQGLSFHSPDPDEDFFNRQEFSENKNFIYSNGYTGYLNKRSNKGKVIVSDEIPQTWIEHFLRFAFSWMALENNSLLFHGAGIICNGAGYVFFGPANTGKTTVTEFSTGHTILGDDMILLQQSNDLYHVFATPFNINKNNLKLTNDNCYIKGFFRLRQDKSTFVKKMVRSKALIELLSSVPLASKNYHGNIKAFKICNNIINKIPCYDLHFTKDNSFWRLINGNIK